MASLLVFFSALEEHWVPGWSVICLKISVDKKRFIFHWYP